MLKASEQSFPEWSTQKGGIVSPRVVAKRAKSILETSRITFGKCA